jgi:hypothetical protein
MDSEVMNSNEGADYPLPNTHAKPTTRGENALDELRGIDDRIIRIDEEIGALQKERQERMKQAAEVRDQIGTALDGSKEVSEGSYRNKKDPSAR